MNASIQDKIVKNLAGLNSFQLVELSDFVDFLTRHQKAYQPDPEVIDALCGKYRDRLSSSAEFARRKQEEIGIEEAKWQKR